MVKTDLLPGLKGIVNQIFQNQQEFHLQARGPPKPEDESGFFQKRTPAKAIRAKRLNSLVCQRKSSPRVQEVGPKQSTDPCQGR